MGEVYRNISTFLKKLSDKENLAELFISVGLFLLLTFLLSVHMDKSLDSAFTSIERLLPFINPTSKWWLFLQATIQLVGTVILSYVVKTFVGALTLANVSKDHLVFAFLDKTKASVIIFAFLSFFTQEKLKATLKQLIPKV